MHTVQQLILCTEETTELKESLKRASSADVDYAHERNPTTIFPTSLDIGSDSELEGASMQSMEAFFQQQDDQVDSALESKSDDDTPSKKVTSPVTKNLQGQVLLKKLATHYEQKGKLECHVYFTPRTSAEIWPHLVVTVHED